MAAAEGRLREISGRMLAWYDQNQRNLPWRKTSDPYRVWISEIMLQQTQVDTVIPYYHRFISQFPTVQALAGASLDAVLKVWENMGYYARARNLHAAAKEVLHRFGGELPNTWDELTALPGIGSYTAGAILSIAFGQHVPAVDSNVRRVLIRLFAIDQPLDQGQTRRHARELAGRLVPIAGAGLFNQALMDLGAGICTRREPGCMFCPISDLCEAYRRRLQDVLPVTRRRRPLPHSHVTAGVIWNDCRQLLIAQRRNKGLLGGLWKFPGGVQQSEESLEGCLQRKVREELGVRIRVGKPIASIKHAYTHMRITLHAFQCAHLAGVPQALDCADWRWTTLDRLKDFAFSRVDRKIIEAVTPEVAEFAA